MTSGRHAADWQTCSLCGIQETIHTMFGHAFHKWPGVTPRHKARHLNGIPDPLPLPARDNYDQWTTEHYGRQAADAFRDAMRTPATVLTHPTAARCAAGGSPVSYVPSRWESA